MTERTWKIRDQMPDGSWGPEYTVTLEQYLANVRAKAGIAQTVHAANVAKMTRASSPG